MDNGVKEKGNGKGTIIVILSILLLCAIGFICYDKLLNKNEKKECSKTECNCSYDTVLGEKIGSLKEIKLTGENQIVRIGNSQYKVRIKEDELLNKHLFVDDNDMTNNDVDIKHSYLTDKYIFFTTESQFGENIVFAISEEKGLVVINDNGYSMNTFKINNNYLYSKGGISETGSAEDYKETDLIIKFIDNTLIAVPTK